jgi:hypothetical protein
MRLELIIIVVLGLVINASVLLYTYESNQKTASTACDAAAQVSDRLQSVYRYNIDIAYPQLYRDDAITGSTLATLTKSGTNAIIILESAEDDCLDAISSK